MKRRTLMKKLAALLAVGIFTIALPAFGYSVNPSTSLRIDGELVESIDPETLRQPGIDNARDGGKGMSQLRRDLLDAETALHPAVAHDGGDRVVEINRRLKELTAREAELKRRLADPAERDSAAVTGELSEIGHEQITLMDEREDLTGRAGDGGARTAAQAAVANLARQVRDLKTTDLEPEDSTADVAMSQLDRIERDIPALDDVAPDDRAAVLELRQNLESARTLALQLPSTAALSNLKAQGRILALDEKTAGVSPDTLVQLASYLQRLKVTGDANQLRIVLLRFDNHAGNAAAIPVAEWLRELNNGLSRYSGREIRFEESDFMVVDDPLTLGDASHLNEEVSLKLESGITDYIGRRSFAAQLAGVVESLIAKVFDLSIPENQAVVAVLNPMLAQRIETGQQFVDVALPATVEGETRLTALERLRKL